MKKQLSSKRRKLLFALLAAATLTALLLAAFLLQVEKPFASLTAEKLEKVCIRLEPPGKSLELTKEEREELIPLLQKLKTGRRDDSYHDYCGQAVTFTLTETDGGEISVMTYYPFLVIDGAGYRTEYDSCHALDRFGSELLEKRQ